MNFRSLGLHAALALALLSATDSMAQKTKKPSKKDAIADSTSYAYGMMLGEEIKKGFDQQQLPINREEFIRALSDALLNKGTLKMDAATAMTILDAFGQKMQQQQMEREANAGKDADAKEEAWLVKNVDTKPNIKKTASGMRYEILKEGSGSKPALSSEVTTHYHGTLTSGEVFDSSVERGEPISFPVQGVIQGWQEILQMMPTGSKWRVYIPSKLGYGGAPAGSIPPYSTLIFEIELISFK